jgi:hypothetical protein
MEPGNKSDVTAEANPYGKKFKSNCKKIAA